MALIKEWNHTRIVEDVESEGSQNDSFEEEEGKRKGTRIIDKVSFIPRIPGTGFFLSFIVKLLFTYRHYRLKFLYNRR